VARLYEYQSKKLLEEEGIKIPEGEVALSPDDAYRIAQRLGKPVVLKIQVWVTGRASVGGIQFADTPDEAREKAQQMLGMRVKNFVVEKLLVEEKLSIKKEYFVGLVIDDALKAPVLIFSSVGGTGIEEIARAHPESVGQISVDVMRGLKDYQARILVQKTGLTGKLLISLPSFLVKLYEVAHKWDARSAEINPLVLTEDNRLYAADCHLAVDDYAVFRHPELGIDVAREFDRPPTPLEKIAYHVEKKDYRGTFYFLQMAEDIPGDEKYIGFNGAGGGGSMMSMDAVLNRGFKLANYCDTSGNPSASKVYRAAKIILSQANIKGYFASGSGVASQEQYHSARGLVKAFHEEDLDIPAVIRLGGNFEEEAITILDEYLKEIPGKVEGYGRDDSPEFCADRMEELIAANDSAPHRVRPVMEPDVDESSYAFKTFTGKIHFDHRKCLNCKSHGCVPACKAGILKLHEGNPVLSISEEDAVKGKCTECLACEIFCKFHEQDAITIHLPIPGLKEYRDKIIDRDSAG
jgi:succinyl-CoA synthetase beta subunit